MTDSADIAFGAPDSVTVAYFDGREPVPSVHLDARALVTWAEWTKFKPNYQT